MKSALLFAALTLLIAQTRAADTTAFDGTWSVTQRTEEFKNPDGSETPARIQHFLAYVKNGSMHGEHGTRGEPGWFEINGIINANGVAKLGAHGVTREAGTYEYLGIARFKARHGTAKSFGSRISTFTFVKE